jgi:hypothetical protein
MKKNRPNATNIKNAVNTNIQTITFAKILKNNINTKTTNTVTPIDIPITFQPFDKSCTRPKLTALAILWEIVVSVGKQIFVT